MVWLNSGCLDLFNPAAPMAASKQQWERWISTNLEQIRLGKLERELRPLIPDGNSAVQACIHQDEHAAWANGAQSPNSCTNIDLAQCARSPAVSAELRPLVLFSLNDYLGLSAHPSVKAAAARAAMQVGCGPRSSALVGGFTSEHRQLELELASLKGTEDALLFPTGYAANVAVMTVLASSPHHTAAKSKQQGAAAVQSPAGSVTSNIPYSSQLQQSAASTGAATAAAAAAAGAPQPQVVIFSDELNHASIVDGARLAVRANSAVSLQVYRHNDMAHLESLLVAAPVSARKLVVTDSLFSMDGDFADLQGLAALKQQYGFLLVVDDAHATLVCGTHGGGAAELMGVASSVDVHVGTLSKAAGALGGFVACSTLLRALLLNRGRSVIYSTSLPVPVVAAARAAVQVARSEPWRRQHVWRLTHIVSTQLGIPAASPIIPLVVGSEAAALELSKQLLLQGFHVPAIRPPTVPPGTCRLRVSLSAAHTVAQVEALLAAVLKGLSEMPGVQLTALPHLMDPRQRQCTPLQDIRPGQQQQQAQQRPQGQLLSQL